MTVKEFKRSARHNKATSVTYFSSNGVDISAMPSTVLDEMSVIGAGYHADGSISVDVDFCSTDSLSAASDKVFTETGAIVEGREFSYDEVIQILKERKKLEDLSKRTCERCGKGFIKNTKFNLLDYGLQVPVHLGGPAKYDAAPYVNGVIISSTRGKGKKIFLCDDCIEELIQWLEPRKAPENKK